MTVTAQYAAEHLSELIDAADRGEEVEISRAEKPVLKLVVAAVPEALEQTGRRILGAGRGEIRVRSEEEWHAMDKVIERQMNEAPLMSSGEI